MCVCAWSTDSQIITATIIFLLCLDYQAKSRLFLFVSFFKELFESSWSWRAGMFQKRKRKDEERRREEGGVISFFILLRRLVALASGWWRIITREYRDWDGGDGGVMVATRVHIPADSPLPFFVSLALLDSRGSGWTNGQQWPCGSSQTFSRVLLFLIYLFSLSFFFFFCL